jgi:predicted CXXCH cytochrome family protein
MSASDIVKDTSKELCGSCHYRDSEHRIAASGGFIKHHEQYDELVNSPHRFMQCGTCHDPHKGVKYDGLGGIKNPNNCVNCHSQVALKIPVKSGMTCTSCHMPLASKSAVKTGVDGLLGDIHSHTFRLNTDFNTPMFSEDGKFVLLDEDENAIVKVDFACMKCHDGSSASVQTIESFYENAAIVHDTWGNAVDVGEGWRWSAWLGFIHTDSDPWVYSAEQGWLFIHDQATELNMYMWQAGTAQWLYTTRDTYPYAFNFTSNQWEVQGI